MKLALLILFLTQSMHTYGFSLYLPEDCMNFTVGDCTIAEDSIIRQFPTDDAPMCQEVCRQLSSCILFSHDGLTCSLLSKEYRKSCGNVGAPVDVDMDHCQDAIVESCSGFDEENCQYLGESVGVHPPNGEVSGPLVCQSLCETFGFMGCTFWVYKDKEQSCQLLKSNDRRCTGISGPRAPPIEDCGFWASTTTHQATTTTTPQPTTTTHQPTTATHQPTTTTHQPTTTTHQPTTTTTHQPTTTTQNPKELNNTFGPLDFKNMDLTRTKMAFATNGQQEMMKKCRFNLQILTDVRFTMMRDDSESQSFIRYWRPDTNVVETFSFVGGYADHTRVEFDGQALTCFKKSGAYQCKSLVEGVATKAVILSIDFNPRQGNAYNNEWSRNRYSLSGSFYNVKCLGD